jgi:hypothetical protein
MEGLSGFSVKRETFALLGNLIGAAFQGSTEDRRCDVPKGVFR